MNDDLLKRARQIHRTDSREIIEELVAALESDRAKLAEAQQTIADFEDFLQQELTMRAAGRQGVLLNEEVLKLDAERAADRAHMAPVWLEELKRLTRLIDDASARVGQNLSPAWSGAHLFATQGVPQKSERDWEGEAVNSRGGLGTPESKK